MMRNTTLPCLIALGLGMGAPGIAQACIPPLPMTSEEQQAYDLQSQADLWARNDLVFAAVVTAVEGNHPPSDSRSEPRVSISERINVTLQPIVLVKGRQALPASYEIRDIFVGCAPQGLQRAQVGQRYLIYGPPSSEYGRAGGIVEVDRLKDAETLLAVYQASALAAMGQ